MTENAIGEPSTDTAPAPSRREQILAAAAELFARRGFHGVGIDDIGSAVGVSGPALYRHFRSKEAMLGEMLTGISEKLLLGGRSRSDASVSRHDTLHALVDWHIEFALTNPDLITVHMRDLDSLAEQDRDRVRELQREYVEVWVTALCGTRPEMDRHTARASTHAVLGLINSTPHSAKLDTSAMGALLRRMAMGALTS